MAFGALQELRMRMGSFRSKPASGLDRYHLPWMRFASALDSSKSVGRAIGFAWSQPDSGGDIAMKAFYKFVDSSKSLDRTPCDTNKQWDARFWIASVDRLQIENTGDGLKRRSFPIPTIQDRAIEEANNG